MPNFVHLHTHSHYSLLDGLSKIPELVARVKELGMTAAALTDHGVMYGVIEFYKECKRQGIKPVLGMEAYVAVDSRHKKSGGSENNYNHLTLLAKNLTGYKNLIKLATEAHLEGFYYKPRIDKELLEKYHEGLIALSGCLQGEIAKHILANQLDAARQAAIFFREIFGKNNFYLEVQSHPSIKDQQKVNEGMKKLSTEIGLEIVATADSHYLKKEDREAQDILLCVQMGKTVDNPNRLDMREIDVSLKSPQDMFEAFSDMPEAVSNTVKIANMCEIELDLGKWNFPAYPVPDGKGAEDFLRETAFNGLEVKYGLPREKVEKVVVDRLEYELLVINKKGFSTYFLVVADYVNWARKQGVICATRGSAAGSFVSYCIGITTENPLKFRLPFERFLNPERPSPPDIDMDFADDRRDEVLNYVREKYGKEKVAQICTFGAMMARAAVRDVARALGYQYNVGDRIAKMIPFGMHGFHMTLDGAMEQNNDLKLLYEQEPDVKRIINLARKVEGSARHASVHAAGVVISPTDITDFTPLQLEPGGNNVITQYDMHACEDVGLIKMDFLGVRSLSILGLARDIIKQTKNINIDLQNLDLEDSATYELLASGETMGVFQLSSSGMIRYLKELKPSNIFDIMAMVALYRPGPMNSIPEFVKRKHNPSLITYLDPRLGNILDKSYGVLTYQDDVLLIAIQLAGYTWGEADKLRKAMGKKIPKEMAKQKEKFINGCVENGMNKLKAEAIWNLIEPFAAYGFNLAHAASYAMIAYQTAYLKAHYAAEYMTAILTAESGNTEKQAEAVTECRRIGIEVLPPSVNTSQEGFTYIDDKRVRFGLLAIKNVGSDIVKAIIEERDNNGKYETLEDFLTRVPSKNLNKKSLEAFIMSGALDDFDDRRAMLDNIDKLLNFRRDIFEGSRDLQGDLFAAIRAGFARPKIILEKRITATVKEKLNWEKQTLGLYISSHPFDEYKKKINSLPISNLSEEKEKIDVTIAGIVSGAKKIFTKSGEAMYFVKLDDGTGIVELIVFPRVAKIAGRILEDGVAIMAQGKISLKDGEIKVLANEIKKIDETAPRENEAETFADKSVLIDLTDLKDKNTIAEIKDLLARNPGNHNVFFVFKNNNINKKIATNLAISPTKNLLQNLKSISSVRDVKIVSAN